jgi:hypothetical protein
MALNYTTPTITLFLRILSMIALGAFIIESPIIILSPTILSTTSIMMVFTWKRLAIIHFQTI